LPALTEEENTLQSVLETVFEDDPGGPLVHPTHNRLLTRQTLERLEALDGRVTAETVQKFKSRYPKLEFAWVFHWQFLASQPLTASTFQGLWQDLTDRRGDGVLLDLEGGHPEASFHRFDLMNFISGDPDPRKWWISGQWELQDDGLRLSVKTSGGPVPDDLKAVLKENAGSDGVLVLPFTTETLGDLRFLRIALGRRQLVVHDLRMR